MYLETLASQLLGGEQIDLDYRDEGYIELVLKILGLMCDGQNATLQVGTHSSRCYQDYKHIIDSYAMQCESM